MSALRVMTIAHGHPTISAGGAEVAALVLHRALADRRDIEALHLSCAPAGGSYPPTGRANERVVESAALDPFHLLLRDAREHARLIAELQRFGPDVVHFHHVLGFGADAITAVRKTLPQARIVLTLHEYLGICHANGQMLTPAGELCEEASPERCAVCFPDYSTGAFRLRRQMLQAVLSEVDAFISPSAFLAKRYCTWGLPQERMHVIENGARPSVRANGRATTADCATFAFFGQINPFKGLDLLLESISLVPAEQWGNRRLDIHGSGLDRQGAAFRGKIERLAALAGDRARFCGPYANTDVDRLMREADWIVVPSVWWENAPVVIQEAFRNRRPVITADIGGMAEKVRDGVDGLLFRARDPDALAAALAQAMEPGLRARLKRGIQMPASAMSVAARHSELYRTLTGARRPEPASVPG